MFYISGCINGWYNITDTKDNVTEMFSKKQVEYMVKQKHLQIGGVSILNNGDLYIPCTSSDVLHDLVVAISIALSQLRLMGKSSGFSYEISEIAKKFGFSTIKFDAEYSTILLTEIDCMLYFNSDGTYECFSPNNRLNVLNDNSYLFNALGEDIFRYQYLEIDNKKYSISDLLTLLKGLGVNEILNIIIDRDKKLFFIDSHHVWYKIKFNTKRNAINENNNTIFLNRVYKSYLDNVFNSASMNDVVVSQYEQVSIFESLRLNLDSSKEDYIFNIGRAYSCLG